METNISDGAIEFSVKNCIAGESYRFGAKKSPAPASNPGVYGIPSIKANREHFCP